MRTTKARHTATPTKPGRPSRTAADDPLSGHRVQYLVAAFGGATVAGWVGVNRSQTSRWASGEERPWPVAAPLLIDLEHVVARARLVWGETAVRTWLTSPNSFLAGSRPIEVLQVRGPGPVLEALDAESWGGAARVLVYRVFPYLATAVTGEPGHPLFERFPQLGSRVDHPDYHVWYLSRHKEAACGEAFGNLSTWERRCSSFQAYLAQKGHWAYSACPTTCECSISMIPRN